MINLSNIYSLTDFKLNAKELLDRLKTSDRRSFLPLSPLVLTVNGKAEVVIQGAADFQATHDRLKQVEAELQQLKLEALKREIAIGSSQLQNGEYTDYDDDTLPSLLETIKARAQSRSQ
jgi:PHD/YefM family antitoxin component YafN of YafNO toxin-antitoxin module